MDQTTTTDGSSNGAPGAAPEHETEVLGSDAPAPASSPEAPDTTFESLALVGFVFGLFAIVIAVFAVGLAARAVGEASGSGGAAGGGGNAPASLDMTLADFSLDPDETEVSVDGVISLTNAGAVAHDLVIEDQKSPSVDPGATGELALDGLAPGQYTMYCDIPGHRDAGMEGTITVK